MWMEREWRHTGKPAARRNGRGSSNPRQCGHTPNQYVGSPTWHIDRLAKVGGGRMHIAETPASRHLFPVYHRILDWCINQARSPSIANVGRVVLSAPDHCFNRCRNITWGIITPPSFCMKSLFPLFRILHLGVAVRTLSLNARHLY